MNSENSTKQIINRGSLLKCLVCVCFVSAAHAVGSTPLSYMALFVYLCIITFAKTEDLLQLMLFFVPWSAVLKPTPYTVSFCSVAMLIAAVKLVLKPKLRFRTSNLIVWSLFACITVFAKLLHTYPFGTQYILFLTMLMFFPIFLENYKDDISFENAVVFYSFGIISATVISLIFKENTNMEKFIRVIEQESIGITRLSGFYPDPNFYAAQITTAIGLVLVLINKSTLSAFFSGVLTISLVLCGIITVSKSFMICLLSIVAIWLFCCLIERKGHSKIIGTIFLLTVCIAILLVTGVVSELIDEYLIRFGMSNDARSFTTGRSEIWKRYLRYFAENPGELLIGKGFTSTLVGIWKGSPNTIIQCLYQLGIFGTVIIIRSVHGTLYYLKKSKAGFGYSLLILVSCFSMWLGIDVLFWDDFFLTISLFIVGMCYVGDKNQNLKKIQNTDLQGRSNCLLG